MSCRALMSTPRNGSSSSSTRGEPSSQRPIDHLLLVAAGQRLDRAGRAAGHDADVGHHPAGRPPLGRRAHQRPAAEPLQEGQRHLLRHRPTRDDCLLVAGLGEQVHAPGHGVGRVRRREGVTPQLPLTGRHRPRAEHPLQQLGLAAAQQPEQHGDLVRPAGPGRTAGRRRTPAPRATAAPVRPPATPVRRISAGERSNSAVSTLGQSKELVAVAEELAAHRTVRSTPTCRQSRSNSASLWLTNSTVMPSATSAETRSNSRPVSSADSAAVGSSRIRISGRRASALASTSSCRSDTPSRRTGARSACRPSSHAQLVGHVHGLPLDAPVAEPDGPAGLDEPVQRQVLRDGHVQAPRRRSGSGARCPRRAGARRSGPGS